jgi:hypothetical protein
VILEQRPAKATLDSTLALCIRYIVSLSIFWSLSRSVHRGPQDLLVVLNIVCGAIASRPTTKGPESTAPGSCNFITQLVSLRSVIVRTVLSCD